MLIRLSKFIALISYQKYANTKHLTFVAARENMLGAAVTAT